METRAAAVEAMSEKEVLELKCGVMEKNDYGRTMQQILDGAVTKLEEYVQGLWRRDKQQKKKFDIFAFVVLTVGSRKLVWKRFIFYVVKCMLYCRYRCCTLSNKQDMLLLLLYPE
jgi:hypothetical protein